MLQNPASTAVRPPDNVHFQKDRDTIEKRSEKRSGRWLKDLAHQSHATGFDLKAWISAWDAGGTGRRIPGRN